MPWCYINTEKHLKEPCLDIFQITFWKYYCRSLYSCEIWNALSKLFFPQHKTTYALRTSKPNHLNVKIELVPFKTNEQSMEKICIVSTNAETIHHIDITLKPHCTHLIMRLTLFPLAQQYCVRFVSGVWLQFLGFGKKSGPWRRRMLRSSLLWRAVCAWLCQCPSLNNSMESGCHWMTQPHSHSQWRSWWDSHPHCLEKKSVVWLLILGVSMGLMGSLVETGHSVWKVEPFILNFFEIERFLGVLLLQSCVYHTK